MTASLVLAIIWAVAANLAPIVWSHENHSGRGYALLATGVPLLGLVTWQHGPWIGFIVLAAGMFILRWPVANSADWLRSRFDDAVD